MTKFAFDTTFEQRVEMARKLMREPGMLEAWFGEIEGRPLALGLGLAGDDDYAKPVAQFDIGRLLRGTMKWAGTECAGYGGWPNLRATRDAMAQLVEEMDKWDRRCNRK